MVSVNPFDVGDVRFRVLAHGKAHYSPGWPTFEKNWTDIGPTTLRERLVTGRFAKR